jgi:hypothetical protein
MEPDRSEILLISISLCFIIGGVIFALMVLAREYGTFQVPYGPYILLGIAVLIVILAGLIVLFGVELEEKQGW